MPSKEKCLKCDGLLDTTGIPKWCRKCRAAKQRDYQDTLESRAEAKGFARGVRACREMLVQVVGSRGITGHAAAQLIDRGVSGNESMEVTLRRGAVQMMGG